MLKGMPSDGIRFDLDSIEIPTYPAPSHRGIPRGSSVMSDRKIFIVGAGGLGREVLATLEASGEDVCGFLVEGNFPAGQTAGIPVYNDSTMWLAAETIAVAIGDAVVRRRLAPIVKDRSFVTRHPAANIGPRVSIGMGTAIIGIANITCDVSIGDYVLINPGCTVSHDCSIGSFSNLGPSVSLAGNVHVGQGVNLGTGAIVLPGCTIGDGATIAAGAVVTKHVEPGTTVYGVPAKRSV